MLQYATIIGLGIATLPFLLQFYTFIERHWLSDEHDRDDNDVFFAQMASDEDGGPMLNDRELLFPEVSHTINVALTVERRNDYLSAGGHAKFDFDEQRAYLFFSAQDPLEIIVFTDGVTVDGTEIQPHMFTLERRTIQYLTNGYLDSFSPRSDVLKLITRVSAKKEPNKFGLLFFMVEPETTDAILLMAGCDALSKFLAETETVVPFVAEEEVLHSSLDEELARLLDSETGSRD